MHRDSSTLLKLANLEYKAAGAFMEEAEAAKRLRDNMLYTRDVGYAEALRLGVPVHIASAVAMETTRKAEQVNQLGEQSALKAQEFLDRYDALMVQYDEQKQKELRVRFSG